MDRELLLTLKKFELFFLGRNNDCIICQIRTKKGHFNVIFSNDGLYNYI